MKTDTYTKIVLTIIAVCLVSLVLKPANSLIGISSANAQDYSGNRVVDVNIVSIDGRAFGPGQVRIGKVALPVKISGD